MNTKITFKDINFNEKVQETLDRLGFTEPTEIQQQAIPTLLENRKVDFHGQAQTGTGKTLAFGLPLIHRIDVSNKATQALVVAPTRELAVQICESLKPFAQALNITYKPIYGGASMEEQIRALKNGVQLVVGTPGRINDLLRRGIMKLDQLKTLVLDEADIMLDMGFKEEVDEILNLTHKEREIWLFSATVKPGIRAIMQEHMRNTVSVSVSKQKVSTSKVKQYYCMVPMKARLSAVCRFIEAAPEFYGFIFCQTKILTSEVADELRRRGYVVGSLHGDMSQDQRNAVIKKFKSREYSIVVATDVAARGLDIQDLTHVINFSLPEDHESYVHRTGRTGRAGKEGVAITFINKHDVKTIAMIQRKFNIVIEEIKVPSRNEIIAKRMEQATTYLEQLLSQDASQAPESVVELVKKFSETDLQTLVTRFVQEKFLDSILREDDSAFAASAHQGPQFDVAPGSQEIMLAVGTDDNIGRDDIVEFIAEEAGIAKDLLQKIRVLRRRTFIEIKTEQVNTIVDALRGTTLAGRPVRAQLVEDSQSRGGSRGGDNRGRSSRRDFGRSSRGGSSRRDSSRRDYRSGGPRKDFGGRSDFAYRG